jgi:hypothetical protein
MKSILDSIFSKNTKPIYQNQGHQNIPEFAITENGPMKNDYEVAEISYEEFIQSVSQERRKVARGNGEIRSSYNT